MKIVPFPSGGKDAAPDAAVIAELEAALAGAAGPGAASWRELRDDVRVLASPIDPSFERALYERLAASSAAQDSSSGRRRSAAPRLLKSWWSGHALGSRLIATGGAGAMAALLIAVLILAGPLRGGHPSTSVKVPRGLVGESESATTGVERHAAPSIQGTSAGPSAATAVPAPAPSAPASGSSTGQGRVEQLGASLTLGASAGEVQKVADWISRVVIAEGGYVANSQVQVEKAGSSNATLNLSVPSARLARTLAALGRLGAVRAETQSQQDITDSYGAAKRALADAVAERAALLRALGAATTQAEIESLHQRLAISGRAIARTRTAFGSISRQAANANVEVTVLGDGHTNSGGLTLHSGLHDAGRVLEVALIVLLITLAALVPILLVGFAVALAARAIRRGARERALSGS